VSHWHVRYCNGKYPPDNPLRRSIRRPPHRGGRFTHIPCHVWPWIDKDEEISKSTYPPIISGYVNDGESKHSYTFATITIVGNDPPIILGIKRVKEHSEWEPADSKADIVGRLVSRAQ
jgi:hypothetical protein